MIQLKNVTKDYVTSSNTVHALKGVTIAFRQNEFVAILGPSGGGKTTLLNIIGGLDKYTNGDLVINGKSTVEFKDHDWDWYRNHSVGFVFQTYNLIPHQSVLANVELALTISGESKAMRKSKARAALESVGLSDQCNKKPNQLSGGQMQRVAIARALVNNPDILLADEPTGALDTASSLQVMDLLKEIAKDRLVVMVTHNPDLANAYATRIVKLTDGEIISDSNPYHDEEENTYQKGKAKMGVLTAFFLSLQNLMTKRGRTILTSFAGSIGIIGIALILSLSTGVNKYIDDVQTNSLSSYPLTIENNTADFTSLMSAMMGSIVNTNRVDGKIYETPMASDMFEQVGKNDIKGFKQYLEDNQSTIDPLLSSKKYSYGTTLQVYKADTSEKITQLSPSTIIPSAMASSYARFTYGETFQEMIDNQELLTSQYEVVAGQWPSKYDECVLVVYDKYTIADYYLYALGVRDPEELSKLVKDAFKGEAIRLDNELMSFNYDDFLNMTFKVVAPADFYRYNSEFDIWEDMRDDDSYLKKVIADSLDLKIVGIIAPMEGTSSTALSPGIGYTSELTTYLIKQASEKPIVKEQLADSDSDVFSRKSFEEMNNNDSNDSNINFKDMISIDRDALQSAFGSTLDPEALNSAVANYITSALSKISVNTQTAYDDVSGAVGQIASGMMRSYVNNHGTEAMGVKSITITSDDIETMSSEYFASENPTSIINALQGTYYVPQVNIVQMLQPLAEGVCEARVAMGGGHLEYYDNTAIIDDANNTVLAQPSFTTTLKIYANTFAEAKQKKEVADVMGSMATNLITTTATSMNVDSEKLAGAFKFNFDEEEISRLINTYMTSSDKDYNAENNLRSLGYGDLDNPTSISLYFNDFENKNTFKDLISEYNDAKEAQGKNDEIISYTDITGILMSSVTTIIDAISYILIAFVSVSLIVSSIMIGIITYISVLERTKEIGILRALGASKGDVANIFNAETFIIGLVSGCVGIVTTIILLIPINAIIHKATGIAALKAILPVNGAIYLIIISIVLSLIAGIIPASVATKRDPVEALRSE